MFSQFINQWRQDSGTDKSRRTLNKLDQRNYRINLVERRKQMKRYIFLVMFLSLCLVISCAPRSHFGVSDKSIGVPFEFGETEDAIAQAERSPGAKYCPEKIARAKELGKQGVETWWACLAAESMKLLMDARNLAKEAEGCQPPPSPPPPKPTPPKPTPPKPPTSDTTAPSVTILFPPGSPTYSTSASKLNMAGSATDNVGVTQVTWSNDRGGSGTCTGTTEWSASDVPLAIGQNVIKVTARDAAGNVGSDALTVIYTPPKPEPAPPKPKPEPPKPKPEPAPPKPAPAPPEPKPVPPPPAPPKAAAPPVFDNIYFDLNKTNINPTAVKALDQNGTMLKENAKIKVEIGGHTDAGGSGQANQKISEKRAQSIKKYLQDKFNIAEDRMMIKGYGSTKPVADNKTTEGRAKNRRVEFRILP